MIAIPFADIQRWCDGVSMFSPPEMQLPLKIRGRGTLRGNEWAWPIADIPDVIEAARIANLASVGGQLQFRLPLEGTCELYWIEVDTLKVVSNDLSWRERVEQTAEIALAQFFDLRRRFDFLAEGQAAFGEYLDKLRAEGGNPCDAMYFVWYLESQPEH